MIFWRSIEYSLDLQALEALLPDLKAYHNHTSISFHQKLDLREEYLKLLKLLF